MIAKIKDGPSLPIQQYQKNEAVKNEEAKNEIGKNGCAASAFTERVDLSSRAKEVQRITKVLEQLPDIREGKVQELKRQIDNGTYAVDSDKVAAKMVGESLMDLIS